MGAQDFPNLTAGANDGLGGLVFQGAEAEARRKVTIKRSLIQWQLPHLGDNQFIEMYVNPQSIQFQSRKEINRVRTKGGYITQYWGEDLDTISVSGTTGSAGIEGINVLRDIYRSEQLALFEIVKNSVLDKRRQSLMQLACSVTMWYQGQGYRGYFQDMQYTESVNTLGLFDYTITFMVVEIMGSKRRNFMPWHRHPWSTTETPNSYSDQSTVGGGYAPGVKVGQPNIPPMDLSSRITLTGPKGFAPRIVQVAVLRGDSKDGSSEKSFTFRGTDSGKLADQTNLRVRTALSHKT